MIGTLTAVAASGALLPESLMHSGPVRVLAAFVTINTVMYGALAVAKILPAVHPSTWFGRANRRGDERSIHPDGREALPVAARHGGSTPPPG